MKNQPVHKVFDLYEEIQSNETKLASFGQEISNQRKILG